MGLSLYQMAEPIRQIMQDEEIPLEHKIDTIELLSDDFKEKAQKLAAYIREVEAEATAYDDEVKRLAERKRLLNASADRLKDYLRDNMEKTSISKIEGLFKITLGKPSQVVEVNEATLPQQYFKVSVSPDKTELAKLLKQGATIQGASLVDGKSKLIIK
jgi:hypothetical protein